MVITMAKHRTSPPPADVIAHVRQSFLIFPAEDFFDHLKPHALSDTSCANAVSTAIQGLQSALSAASLPFKLVQDSAYQRHFNRIHSSEHILALIPINAGEMTKSEAAEHADAQADAKMLEFLSSDEGREIIRDDIIYALSRHLKSEGVSAAANELLIQTLISIWSVFESFSRNLIVQLVNDDPNNAEPILKSPDLKDFFGKQVIDIQTIGDHGYDLSKSMGDIIFRGRRLDSLSVIKSVFKSLFDSSDVQVALGDLRLLNQRRHLFIHNRGIVDADYLRNSGDNSPIGKRLTVRSDDIKDHLKAVQIAIIAICVAGEAA